MMQSTTWTMVPSWARTNWSRQTSVTSIHFEPNKGSNVRGRKHFCSPLPCTAGGKDSQDHLLLQAVPALAEDALEDAFTSTGKAAVPSPNSLTDATSENLAISS